MKENGNHRTRAPRRNVVIRGEGRLGLGRVSSSDPRALYPEGIREIEKTAVQKMVTVQKAQESKSQSSRTPLFSLSLKNGEQRS